MLFRKLKYWSGYTVVRWQLILTLALLLFSWYYLDSNYSVDSSTDQRIVMDTYFRLISLTIIILFTFSCVSVLLTWLFFIYRKRRNLIGLQMQFGNGQDAEEGTESGKVPLTITASNTFRPFLGTVRTRLVFAGMKVSESVLLDENIYEKRSLIRKAIYGTGLTELHDRGIYDVEEVQILFGDMFRLIVLPFTLRISKQLYTLPQELKAKEFKAEPNATEEQLERIEIPKKIEGEFINYKDFESGDDVRRIVWKIYARSGQLVVRIPETKDPYASHLYYYASFYNTLNDGTVGIFEIELLNAYKDKVRNLFESLAGNGYEVRIPADQEVQQLAGMSDKKNELFQITAAHWQKNLEPAKFVVNTRAAFVSLSSLVPANDVAQLLGNIPQHIPVVIVRMSDAIVSPFSFRFKNIFFIPEKKANDNLRNPWLISPLRSRLLENERLILRMIQQRGNGWMISASEKS